MVVVIVVGHLSARQVRHGPSATRVPFPVSVGGGFWARASVSDEPRPVRGERGGRAAYVGNAQTLRQRYYTLGDTEHEPPARVPLLLPVRPPPAPPDRRPLDTRATAADAYLQSEPKVSLRRAADVSRNIMVFGFCVGERAPGRRPCDRNNTVCRVKHTR